jgi:hypothetical protein
MQSQQSVLFDQIPNLSTTRQAFGINSFQIHDYLKAQPTYRGKSTYNAVVTLHSTRSYCDLALTYDDAFLLVGHLA